jgi:two-component system, LuxR family, response regulator FixJ
MLDSNLGMSLMVEHKPDTIAVIDDDEAVRQSIAFLLGVVNYRVETFTSAIEFLQESSNRFLCLIVDQHMPGMTGLELVRHVRSAPRRMPVMLLSGGLTEADRRRAEALKVERVVEKPADEGRILEFVTSVAART